MNMYSISDEEQHSALATHHPLIKEISNREFRPFDFDIENKNPDICVFGYEMFPVGVELSQWGFPVVYVAENEEKANQAKIDSERHAGKFKKITHGPIVSSRIAVWGGVLSNMEKGKRKEFISKSLRCCGMIVCSESSRINWERDLGKDYNVRIIRYYSNSYLILHITEK